MTRPADEDKRRRQAEPARPRLLCSATLFAGEREVIIEHAGERYRLRITRRNKLILQK